MGCAANLIGKEEFLQFFFCIADLQHLVQHMSPDILAQRLDFYGRFWDLNFYHALSIPLYRFLFGNLIPALLALSTPSPSREKGTGDEVEVTILCECLLRHERRAILSTKAIKFILESRHKLRQVHSIHHPMIAAQGHMNGMTDMQTAIHDNRALFDCANRQNGHLGWVDHGGKMIDLFDHTKITYRKSCVL